MSTILELSYKIPRRIFRLTNALASKAITLYKFKVFGVKYGKFKTNGIPQIDIFDKGKMIIGSEFKMNNGRRFNVIGRQQPCIFVIEQGELLIGNNVGISCSAFHCKLRIEIGDNVRIGGNTVIYDSDFHSLDPNIRVGGTETRSSIKMAPVKISKNAFIAAHTTILKGVTVGENSIVGAGSVVSKSIPPNEIWAGNPARFLRKID